MRVGVLGIEATEESGKKLAAALGGKFSLDSGALRNLPLVVRWGTSHAHEFPHVMNKAEAIKLNVNKPEATEAMQDVVSVPRLYHFRVPAGKKAVVRKAEHARGVGFKIVDGPMQLKQGEYAAEFIDTDIERRVWFIGDSMRCAQRVAVRGQNNPAEKCRSKWGYELRDVTPTIRGVVMKAAGAIGLDFGAVDLLWDRAQGRYVVLEINSAPSLDTPGLMDFFKSSMDRHIRAHFPLAAERRMEQRRQADRRVNVRN